MDAWDMANGPKQGLGPLGVEMCESQQEAEAAPCIELYVLLLRAKALCCCFWGLRMRAFRS